MFGKSRKGDTTMARFHYDLMHAEEIQRDVPVYDASTTAGFVAGEFIMLGNTDPDSGVDHGVAFQTGYESSQAEQMVDGLGILLEPVTDGTNATLATGFVYAKAIINPFAVYLTEYDQDSAIAFTSSTVTMTFTGTSEDDIDEGWFYVVSSAVTNAYDLRQIATAASGSFTVDHALTATESAGTGIKILPVNHRLINLTTGATKILMQAAAGAGVSLHIIENYVSSLGYAMQPLRFKHQNQKLDSKAKFYADVCLIDHVYNPNA